MSCYYYNNPYGIFVSFVVKDAPLLLARDKPLRQKLAKSQMCMVLEDVLGLF
jgi:hypothetical protein